MTNTHDKALKAYIGDVSTSVPVTAIAYYKKKQ